MAIAIRRSNAHLGRMAQPGKKRSWVFRTRNRADWDGGLGYIRKR
jgi:hypothetical protein